MTKKNMEVLERELREAETKERMKKLKDTLKHTRGEGVQLQDRINSELQKTDELLDTLKAVDVLIQSDQFQKQVMPTSRYVAMQRAKEGQTA